jgi:hypothetical protein
MDIAWQGKNNAREDPTVPLAHCHGAAESEYEDAGDAMPTSSSASDRPLV